MKVFFMVRFLRLESVSQPFEITSSWLEPVAQNKAARDLIGANPITKNKIPQTHG